MANSSLARLAAALLLLAIPCAAQLTISYSATTTVDASYYAGEPEEDDPPSLTLTTTSTPPASVNFNGATGSFQFDFLAPAGHRFVVDPLDGEVSLGFQVAYTNFNAGGAPGGLSASGTPVITLLGLEGTAPGFYNYSTLGDIPHTYLSVSIYTGGISESFSFTGLRYEVTFNGTGNNLSVPHFEGGNLSVYDGDYNGAAPGAHLELLTVSAIPEPGTTAALVGAAALVAVGCVRRTTRKLKLES